VHYVVAYDIADPRRLRRVARVMERRAVRCQKSVFVFRGDLPGLQALLDEVARLLKPAEDIVQAWKVVADTGSAALSRGTPADIHPASVVIAPRQYRVIDARKPPADGPRPGPEGLP
jgi:CRISPR-associated protein Cas2